MSRLFIIGMLAVPLLIAGCGSQENSRTTESGSNTSAIGPQEGLTSEAIEIDDISGALANPEDLCVVIDAEKAREALAYDGRIVTEQFEDPDNVERIDGLCKYMAPDAEKPEGAMAEVTAPGRGPNLEAYRQGLKKAGRTYQEPNVVGADDALWIDHHHTALVRYGDSVGLAQNIGTISMSPLGLIRLAAMTAKAGQG